MEGYGPRPDIPTGLLSEEPADVVPIGAFTSYDLGRVIEAVVADARPHPKRPAGQVLRQACIEWLPWDRRGKSPFEDVLWEARFMWLREKLLGSRYGGGEIEVASIIAPLRAVLADVEKSEEPF